MTGILCSAILPRMKNTTSQPIDAKSVVSYWRNCLADADRMDSAVTKDFIEIDEASLASGHIPRDVFQKLLQAFPKEDSPNGTRPLPVLISPLVFAPNKEHGTTRKSKGAPLEPLWVPALLFPDGKFSAPNGPLPWVARTYLEPSRSDIPTVGSVEDVDAFLTTHSTLKDEPSWAVFWGFAQKLWQAMADVPLEAANVEGYERISPRIRLDTEIRGLAHNLLTLYDHIRELKALPPLLNALANGEHRSIEPLYESYESHHLGQMSGTYGLRNSQRKALSAAHAAKDGDIVAVNGPPGTGKTTLLQSVVASLWVESAITGDEPPVIVACSTNKRAVTNILDNFAAAEIPIGHTLFGSTIAERWLPKMHSYGLYLHREDSEGYQTTQPGWKGSSWSGFVGEIETEDYLQEAEKYYLEHFNSWNGGNASELDGTIPVIHNHLVSLEANLRRVLKTRHELLDCRTAVESYESPEAALVKLESTVATRSEERDRALNKIEEGIACAKDNATRLRAARHEIIEASLPKNILEYLPFAWFQRPRRARLRSTMLRHGFERMPEDRELETVLDAAVHAAVSDYEKLKQKEDSKLQRLAAEQEKDDQALKRLQKAVNAWRKAEADWQQTLDDIAEKSETPPQTWAPCISKPEEANALLDQFVRCRLFYLAGRYWEGRWLQEMASLLDPKLGDEKRLVGRNKENCMARFRRFTKLTPCMVSTFHTLSGPNWFDWYDGETHPLFDYIDLLIVDEAGQVAPDVGAPLFALAKKALVVGDVYQIEPIWGIPTGIDQGNLIKHDLASQSDALSASGRRACDGSLMKAAQHASAYGALGERGMLLSEHSRCAPDIISYCNELVYGGRLQSLRAEPQNRLLPAMGFAHIDAPSTRKSGSHVNTAEADVISEWIAQNRKRLTEHYNTDQLQEVLAIITPFRAQASAIKAALRKVGIKHTVTIGTVHAMQGAALPIILFSPVYGNNAIGQGYFFDRGANMLNVAVSRAKDSFLVFGNMALFDPEKPNSPSGLLARHLFADPANEITNVTSSPILATIAAGQNEIRRIDTLDEHRDLLHKAIERSQKRLLIFSPFLSIHALEADSLIPLLRDAVSRKVDIRILYDRNLNLSQNGRMKPAAAKARDCLKKAGIPVHEGLGLHNKTLAVDSRVIIEGSFNWLSASRTPSNAFHRHEVSILYQGSNAAEFIETAWRKSDHFLPKKPAERN